MKKVTVIYFFLSCLYITSQAQAEHDVTFNKPSIQVIGMGKVYAVPDAVEIVILLKSKELLLKSAINTVENQTAGLSKSIRKFLTDSNDIVIDLPTTMNLYQWDQKTMSDKTTGYEASQKVTISIFKISELQEFFQELFKIKFHAIERLSYFNRDELIYFKQVRQSAITDADNQTNEIAAAKKVKIGKLNYLETNEVFVDQGKSSFYNLETFDTLLAGQTLLYSTKKIVYACTVKMITEIN